MQVRARGLDPLHHVALPWPSGGDDHLPPNGLPAAEVSQVERLRRDDQVGDHLARTPPSPHAPSSLRSRSRYALVTPPATKPGSRTMRRWSASVVGGPSMRNSSSAARSRAIASARVCPCATSLASSVS